MYQNTLIKNLSLPETTIGFALNIFFKFYNLIFVPSPQDFALSCNTLLLEKYDTCNETRGKISFIPLEFLLELLGDDKTNFTNLLDKKKYYIDKLEKEYNLNSLFFAKNSFKGVPLQYFRKPYLTSDLTKTIDHCRITYDTEEENITNIKINLNLLNPATDIVRNQNEWLSKHDIVYIINAFLYYLNEDIRNDVNFKGMLYINNKTYLTRQFFYSQLKESFNWSNSSKSRFILFFILYRSHFTAIFIDLNVMTKNNHKTKFAYFFNSCGYDPNNFSLDKNYWFINSSMAFMNHRDCFVEYISNNYLNTPIEAITDILKKEHGVTNFVFNTFCIQNLDSECGMFSTLFLLCSLNMLACKSKSSITVHTMRHVYFNMISLGSDHIYSCFRGLFFFTNEDAEKYKINKTKYLSSPLIYKIQNNKYINYCKIYKNALVNCKNLGNYSLEIIKKIENI
jgi:hypothetical protein